MVARRLVDKVVKRTTFSSALNVLPNEIENTIARAPIVDKNKYVEFVI